MQDLRFTCSNCQAEASGTFCSSCGQKKFDRTQFELKHAVREFFAEFSDIESSLGTTLKTLILKPGKLTADYLQGKQKSYVSPVKLYLLVIAANFLFYTILEKYSFINITMLKRLAADASWFQHVIIKAQQQSGLMTENFFHEVNAKVNDILPILLYLLIFAQAFVLALQFRNHQRYYIEHLIFALHFMSFGFLRDMALLPIQLINKDAGFIVSITTTIVYLFFSLHNAYFINGRRLWIQTVLHYVIFFILFSMIIISSVLIALKMVA